jgi:hypothetical protein
MTNTEAAELIGKWLETYPYSKQKPVKPFMEALGKAITALRHQPEPQRVAYPDFTAVANEILCPVCMGAGTAGSLQCSACGWRTLDTHRLLCDSCGGHELKPVYEVGK